MSYLLFPSSGNHVSFEPEWDFERADRKIENEHRTREGARYVYKWGEYERFKFGATFVSSADAAIVNSWWSTNTKLLFMSSSDTATVFSLQITNDARPFAKFQPPYDNLYQGTIELEGY